MREPRCCGCRAGLALARRVQSIVDTPGNIDDMLYHESTIDLIEAVVRDVETAEVNR